MALADLIPGDGVILDLGASSRKQVLQSLAELAAETTGLNARTIFDAVLQRERLGSTGVGQGVAIPHARIRGNERVQGFFARLRSPVDFESIDGRPADLIFMLIAPEDAGAEHLKADSDLLKTEEKLKEVKKLIYADSITFSMAVKKYGSDKEQSYNNDGRMMNPQTQNTFFQMNELDPDIFFTIDTMKVGELSNPFQIYDMRGEVQYKVIQLQSRTDPHTANLLQDYSKIQAAAGDKKRNEFINEWVEQTIKDTFIEIKSDFESCPEVQRWISE